MNLSTRERLLRSATELFARSGYRGASVRRICDLANANPGAVSYHFGGKRQLYRAVLRRAAAALAYPASAIDDEPAADAQPLHISEVVDRVFERVVRESPAAELLLRDLADGGEVAVEALEPTLRAALETLDLAIGEEPAARSGSAARALLVDLAAPVFLLTAAWPVLQRALDLEPGQRRPLVTASCRRVLQAHGFPDLAGTDLL
jgi:AcrR family transcriptional regulator